MMMRRTYFYWMFMSKYVQFIQYTIVMSKLYTLCLLDGCEVSISIKSEGQLSLAQTTQSID